MKKHYCILRRKWSEMVWVWCLTPATDAVAMTINWLYQSELYSAAIVVCTKLKLHALSASMNGQRLCLWYRCCLCNLSGRCCALTPVFTDRPDARGISRMAKWRTVRFPSVLCTLCPYMRHGTQVCSKIHLHCPYPSQGLSLVFGEKTIPFSQTEVAGFK